MFKKRPRPVGVRAKESSLDSPGPSTHSASHSPPPVLPEDGTGEEADPDLTANIDEMILLRRLRRAKQGIDLDKFNRGEKKGARDDLGSASGSYGLRATRTQRDEEPDEYADEAERMMRMVRTNNFTQQTNALDTDKHMLAYIESEMAKRRGQAEKDGRPLEPLDPQSELYKMAQKYQWDVGDKKAEEAEGNVTNSMGMLTSIPEVDLGMENRLRNIEATEKAKREMEERRRNESKAKKRPEDEDFAAARYHRPTLRIASDIYAANDEQREAAGLPPPRYGNQQKQEQATDAEVYERFKKRMKR